MYNVTASNRSFDLAMDLIKAAVKVVVRAVVKVVMRAVVAVIELSLFSKTH